MSNSKNDLNLPADRSASCGSEATFQAYVKTFLTQPRLVLNFLFLFIFSFTWIRDFLYWFPKDAFGFSLNYWAYTDWLIDYSQGFIRRGLSGEILHLILTWIPPSEFIAIFSWILILSIVFHFLRLLLRSIKSFHPLILFGLLFLPSLFFFYLHDHNAIARKEILGYITVLLHLFIVEKSFSKESNSASSRGNLQRYLHWMIPIVFILLPAIILIHEGNFLLFTPLHAMITLTVIKMKGSRDFLKAAFWSGLLYLPAALAFFAVFFSGTPSYQVLLGICEKWLAVGALRENSCVLPPDRLSGSTLPGSFIPMQWSLAKASYITRIIIFMNWKEWILILLILGFSLYYLVRQAVYSLLHFHRPQSFDSQSAQQYFGLFFRKYFLIPLLLSLPIYFTAYDYGRWFTVTCVNFCLMGIEQNFSCWEYESRMQNKNRPIATISRNYLDNRFFFYIASIFICLLALVLWLPHYCLFSCEIIQSPLNFFSHSFIAR